MIAEGWNFGVWIDCRKAGAKLVSLADANKPSVIFGLCVTGGKQFLKQDRDFDAIGCAKGIELDRVLANGKGLLVGGAGSRAVRTGKFASTWRRPCPDFGRCIIGGSGPVNSLSGVECCDLQAYRRRLACG